MIPPYPWSSDYVSPGERPGWISRTFPWLRFYGGLFGIVWRASRKAKRGDYDDASWVASSADTVTLLESIGSRITVEGTENLSGLNWPVVYVGNHMSTLETFVLPSILRPHAPMTFIVKRELVEMPVFKHVMISRDPVVVGRKSPREDLRLVMAEGEARLRAGISIVVFPQRTRAPWFAPDEFNSIAVKLARRAGVPVVPIALRTDVWGIGSMIKDFGPIRPEFPIRFAFGRSLAVTGNGRETQDQVVSFITGKARAWSVPVVEAEAIGPR